MTSDSQYVPDQTDYLILNNLQKNFPVEARPYEALAKRLKKEHGLDLGEEGLWERVKNLRKNGYIRRLGAVFQSKRLGYHSTLCAARVPCDKIEFMTKLINAKNGVTHNYLRSDELNMWFTYSGQSRQEVADFICFLKKESGLEDIYSLPSRRLLKIKVDFKVGAK